MNYKIYYPLVASTMLLLNACGTGGSSSNSLDESINGKLVDSPVAGAIYKCGKITAKTDENGSFECSTFPIEFYVGKIKLGSIEQLNPNGYVTPQDLAGVDQNNTTDENVTKIAQFLQSLDDDGDIEENIKIDAEIAKNLEAIDTNCSDLKEMTQDEIETLLDTIEAKELVTIDEAIKHLQEHMPFYINCENNNSNYPQGFPPIIGYNGDQNDSNLHGNSTNDFPHRGYGADRNSSNPDKPVTHNMPQDEFDEDTNASAPHRGYGADRNSSNPDKPVTHNMPQDEFDEDTNASAPHRGYGADRNSSNPDKPVTHNMPQDEFDEDTNASAPHRGYGADRNSSNPDKPVTHNMPQDEFDEDTNASTPQDIPQNENDV